VSRKAPSKPAVRKAIPRLLLGTLASEDPSAGANPLLLRVYIALDALQRGKGSNSLFLSLGQHLVIAEQLCRAGFEPDALTTLRRAHAALVRVDWDARSTGEWKADVDEYEALREAILVYEVQLRRAPREAVRLAQAGMSLLLADRPARGPAAAHA
jgi:hypothetical protein